MRRIATVASSVALAVMATALPALASYPAPPQPGGISGQKSTALTGANISLGVIVLLALVVIGVAALGIGMVTKRRAAAHS